MVPTKDYINDKGQTNIPEVTPLEYLEQGLDVCFLSAYIQNLAEHYGIGTLKWSQSLLCRNRLRYRNESRSNSPQISKKRQARLRLMPTLDPTTLKLQDSYKTK